MAARRGKVQAAKQTKASKQDVTAPKSSARPKTQKEVAADHLPPLPLIFVVLFCSGALFMFALRDAIATGKNIAGPWGEAMLVSKG